MRSSLSVALVLVVCACGSPPAPADPAQPPTAPEPSRPSPADAQDPAAAQSAATVPAEASGGNAAATPAETPASPADQEGKRLLGMVKEANQNAAVTAMLAASALAEPALGLPESMRKAAKHISKGIVHPAQWAQVLVASVTKSTDASAALKKMCGVEAGELLDEMLALERQKQPQVLVDRCKLRQRGVVEKDDVSVLEPSSLLFAAAATQLFLDAGSRPPRLELARLVADLVPPPADD